MTYENFKLIVKIYILGWILSTSIFVYRAIKNKPAQQPDHLDVIFWLFGWWFLLPIFTVRWIKYKLRGESI